MPVQLRPARPADAEAIAAIYLAARRDMPYAPLAHSEDAVRNWIRLELLGTEGVTVAERAGQVVGFCAVSVSQEHGWIDQLYVANGSRDRGVGGHLLRQALANLPFPVRLHCFEANANAIRFYARQGFEVIAHGDGSGNEEHAPDVLLERPERRV